MNTKTMNISYILGRDKICNGTKFVESKRKTLWVQHYDSYVGLTKQESLIKGASCYRLAPYLLTLPFHFLSSVYLRLERSAKSCRTVDLISKETGLYVCLRSLAGFFTASLVLIS